MHISDLTVPRVISYVAVGLYIIGLQPIQRSDFDDVLVAPFGEKEVSSFRPAPLAHLLVDEARLTS